jgi:hypothetical protein
MDLMTSAESDVLRQSAKVHMASLAAEKGSFPFDAERYYESYWAHLMKFNAIKTGAFVILLTSIAQLAPSLSR